MNKSANYISILFFFILIGTSNAQEEVEKEVEIQKEKFDTTIVDSVTVKTKEVEVIVEEEATEVAEEIEAVAEEEDIDEEIAEELVDEIEVEEIVIDSSIYNINILSSELDKYNFFFSGENHTYSNSNGLIKDQFIKYFHQNADVKNVIMEFGYVTGYLIDKYVYDNDTSLIGLFDQMPNQSYFNVYENLRKYNLKQADSNKIHVYGVDAQKTPSYIFLAIDYIRKKRDISLAHDSIQLHLETAFYEAGKGINREKLVIESPKNPNMNNFYWRNNAAGVTSLKEFKKNYNKFRKEYMEFFGADSLLLDRVVQTTREYLDYKRFSQGATTYLDVFRERIMIREFSKLHAEDSTRKYFGQFGKCHVAGLYSIELCERYNFESFADRMKKFGIKPLIIGLTYDSEYDQGHHNESFEKALNLAQDRERTLANYTKTDTIYSEPDYVMIVKSSGNEYYEDYEVYYDDDNEEVNVTFNYVYGEKVFPDLSFAFDLNSSTSISFDEKIISHGGSITIFESQSAYMSYGFSQFNTGKGDVNDSLSVKFSGYKSSFVVGYEATPTDVLNLAFYVGLGYSKINIDLQPDANTTGNYLMDANNPVSITNDAYTLDAGADLNLSLSYFNLGLRGGYDWDFTSKNWENAPSTYKTTFSGFYANAYIGFRFKD